MSVSNDWNAGRYATHAGFVPELGLAVLDLLRPQAGERILDLGCGDGVLTARIAGTGATVVGVDASPILLDAARARGLDVRLGDAQALTFDAEFDAVFSNAALHWMREADRVIDGVRRALRPGGRFVGEFGAKGNVAAITVALRAIAWRRTGTLDAPSPWYFPTADEYRARLTANGFRVDTIDVIPRPTPLPTDMAGWLETFGSVYLTGIPEADRAAAIDEAVRLLAPALRDDEGRWTADYVRLRFAATRL